MLTMRIHGLPSLVAAMLVLTTAGVASANYPYSLCRWTGIGWSDGYHSHYGCPPKRHALVQQAGSTPASQPNAMPWWMTPAPEAEQLPPPAPTPQANDASVVGQGVIRR